MASKMKSASGYIPTHDVCMRMMCELSASPLHILHCSQPNSLIPTIMKQIESQLSFLADMTSPSVSLPLLVLLLLPIYLILYQNHKVSPLQPPITGKHLIYLRGIHRLFRLRTMRVLWPKEHYKVLICGLYAPSIARVRKLQSKAKNIKNY